MRKQSCSQNSKTEGPRKVSQIAGRAKSGELDHGHEPAQLESRRVGPAQDTERGLGAQHEARRAGPVQEAERGLGELNRG